jgi:hypothetical protein
MSLLKRIFRNKFFYLAVVLEIFSMFYPHMDTHYFWQTPLYYFSSADFLYFMLMPLRHGIGNLLLPFVAALPSAIFLAQNRRRKALAPGRAQEYRNQKPVRQLRFGHLYYLCFSLLL